MNSVPNCNFFSAGTVFTTNTASMTDTPGSVIYSTNDFNQAIYGLKLLKAGARMKRSRVVVIAGNERRETILTPDNGITLCSC